MWAIWKESIQEKGIASIHFSNDFKNNDPWQIYVKITFMLFEYHRSIDKSIDFFISLCCRKKVHDNKEFSRVNSKPCGESRITTVLLNSEYILVGKVIFCECLIFVRMRRIFPRIIVFQSVPIKFPTTF